MSQYDCSHPRPIICHYRYGIPYYPFVKEVYEATFSEKLDPEHVFIEGEEDKLEALEYIIEDTVNALHEAL